MNNDWLYYGIMFFGVFIASISQLLLKSAAGKQYSHWIRQYLNFNVILGYVIMLMSTVCTIIAMRRVPLSTTPIWNSLGIVLAAFWGKILFKESLSRRKILGLVLVAIGIAVFSI